MDDFHKWQRRTSYVVQCYTTSVQRKICRSGIGRVMWTPDAAFGFRAKREYRSEDTNNLRRLVAQVVTELRRKPDWSMKRVREAHEHILASRGEVTMCDLSKQVSSGKSV